MQVNLARFQEGRPIGKTQWNFYIVTIALKKFPEKKSNKTLQGLFTKNSKISLKKIKDNLNRGINHIFCFGRLNTVKMPILPETDL